MGLFSGVLELLIFKIFWSRRPNRDTKLSLNPQRGPFNVKMLPPPLYSCFPVGSYMLKLNNRNTRTRCEICSN